MTGKQLVETALQGRKPPQLPVFPIYDKGYVMTSIGRDPRDYIVATAKERIEYLGKNFLRHKVDGFCVHIGTSDEWAKNHTVEKFAQYWLITEKNTGEKRRLLPDCTWAKEDGTVIIESLSNNGISKIQCEDDIDEQIPSPPSVEEIKSSGILGPLQYLAEKYPDYHFSFQTGTPMIKAIEACGGYAEGLMVLASEPELFRKILEKCMTYDYARIILARKYGGRSMYFTSYYTGADTVSPDNYAKIVFPYELEICRFAKANGFYVLNWYLGDLMPVLDKVMELPLDGLILEQGRKGYNIDPVQIRKRVGEKFCLFGFAFENDFCQFNYEGLRNEIARQIKGAASEGAFIIGTPIMPANANPEAVDFYFDKAKRLGKEI